LNGADSVPGNAVSPAQTYEQHLRQRQAQAAQLRSRHARIGNVRLLLGAAILAAAWLSFERHAISALWPLLLVALLIGVVLYHHDVQRLRQRTERTVAFYQRGLDRIHDRWMGQGLTGDRFNLPHHVYAADLDLFGRGSLYQLLCSARTTMGQQTLAQWLLSPASLAQIGERQASVADLRARLELREDLAVLGEPAQMTLEPGSLTLWAQSANELTQGWLGWLAPLLAVLAAAGALLWLLGGSVLPLLLVLLIEGCLLYALARPIRTVLAGVEHAFEDLKLLAALLQRIEREPLAAPSLRALVAALSSHSASASRTLARLATIVNLVESRRNLVVRPFILPLLYNLQTALAAERWRRAHGQAVRSWLGVIGELEAAVCLATYSYEHPHDPFPQLLAGTAEWRASALGHPLMAPHLQVTNDVDISGQVRVLLVSGSNMSGKSTLLRAVGINTVLAMAGATVRAQSLQLTPLQVGASIRINDSLHEGSSRFYAEITRLRQLFDSRENALALLFLLDELLQGTNSGDRRIGAQGVLRALVQRGAIGLISTHDLALTDIDALAPGALRNVHFQDQLENGRLTFDFKLRDGVVSRSNGIELMRSIGLEV
jgi:MutS domain V